MVAVFRATKAFDREYDDLFDFVGASAAAIWNMRWQVRGYRDAHPSASQSQLAGHFITGSGIGGFKFEYFTDHDWDHQEEQIARVALTNVIALFERWLEGVEPLRMVHAAGRRPIRPRARQICEALPDKNDPSFAAAATELRQSLPAPSFALTNLWAQTLQNSSRYDGAQLERLLTHFRLFKELRNQFMHRPDEPAQVLLDAYAAATASPYVPRKRANRAVLPVISAGVRPRMELTHAFFACHIVRSLIHTIDVEYGLSPEAELDIRRALSASGPLKMPMAAGPMSRTVSAFKRTINSRSYPTAVGGAELFSLMRSEGELVLT